MNEDLEAMLKYLGLRGVIANWDHYIGMGKKKQLLIRSIITVHH